MENFSMSPGRYLDPRPSGEPETWKVAVPVTLALLFTALVAATLATLFFLFLYKKLRRTSEVAPVPLVSRTMSSGDPPKRNIENESQKKLSFKTTVSFDDEDDVDQLAVTRTQSLTILLPKGQKLTDVFTSTTVDTGEFQEPDVIEGKLRWQIIQLEPIVSDHHSAISLSADEEVTEIVYQQGVYLDWTSTLQDLRSAFVDTNQLDKEDQSFCFLWSDVLGERIDVSMESSLELQKLGHAATRCRTVYIERVDPGTVQKSLCVCGKTAVFHCNDCKNRGYCSHDCELEDTDHILLCSVNISKPFEM